MREIKFKAEYKNKIYEVIAIFFDINQVQLKRENCLSIDVAMIDCKLLDFTGLQDVTGRDIYEGGKMSFNCYYDYSTGKKILISGCYGSLYDRPEYCTCSGGVIDSRKKR